MEYVECDDPKHTNIYSNALKFIIGQIIKLLLYSNSIHLVLKRLKQPSVISQYIAGIVVGNTMSRMAIRVEADIWAMRLLMDKITLFGSFLFMFLIGIEMDFAFLRLSLRRSAYVAFAGIATCTALSAGVFKMLYSHLARKDNDKIIEGRELFFFFTIALFISNTASPVLIRIVTELKLTSSNIGRLAITSGFVNDLATVFAFAFYSLLKATKAKAGKTAQVIFSIGVLIIIIVGIMGPTFVARIINRIHQKKRYIGSLVLIIFIMLVFTISWVSEKIGFSGTTVSFFMGLLMPREGPTTRTMIRRLQYPVHNILLPLYFAQIASKTDLTIVKGPKGPSLFGVALLVTLIGTVGKVVGTVAVTKLFKMPIKEGIVLGMLLNVKGHLDVMLLKIGEDSGLWQQNTKAALIVTIMISTIMTGPVSSLIVWWERRAYKYRAHSLENLGPDSQLRVLACVHGPREVQAILNLVALCKGDEVSPIAVYLQHLVELTQKYTVTLMYHQRTSDGSDLDYGGDIVRQVSLAADIVVKETGVPIREMMAISHYVNMHKDICMGAEDVRASIIILPFHKEQRYDTKMVCRKEGRRHLNNMMIKHAPCTIGILVDRPLSGCSLASCITTTRPSASNSTTDLDTLAPTTPGAELLLNKVVTIFFGGPDDREAASFMVRLATHPLVEATLVRFLPERYQDGHNKSGMSSRFTSQIPMIMEEDIEEAGADEEFISNFHRSYVETGTVVLIERYVGNGPETIEVLSSMAGLYSLFIVGRGGQRLSPMMTGMRDWEECPELGPIGDLFASEDFMNFGSVLIIQQHSDTEKTSLLNSPAN